MTKQEFELWELVIDILDDILSSSAIYNQRTCKKLSNLADKFSKIEIKE